MRIVRGVGKFARPRAGSTASSRAEAELMAAIRAAPRISTRRAERMARIHPTAIVDPGAELAGGRRRSARTRSSAPDVAIGAGTCIGAARRDRRPHPLGARNRIFQFASIGEIPQDRKYGGEPTHHDDRRRQHVPRVRDHPRRHRAGPRRHGHRQRQLVPRLHARRARLRGRQRHDVLQQRADRRPRDHRRLGGARRLRRRAPVLPRRRARDARRRCGRAAGRAAVTSPSQGYPAKPHGTNNEGLRRRGFAADEIAAIRRAYKTLYREGLHARGGARPRSRAAAAAAPALAPLAAFLADARARHRALSGRCRRPTRAGAPSRSALSRARPPATRSPPTLIRAVRARCREVRFVGIAGPRMEAAGCEAWFRMETLAVRGFVEVIAPPAGAVAHPPRRLRAGCVAAARAAVRRRRCARFQSRPGAQLKRRGVRTVHFVSPSVWAWRRERARRRSARASIACSRCFRSSRRSTRRRHAGHLRRPSAGAGRGHARARGRETREQLKLERRHAGVRAAAGQPHVGDRDARASSCSTTAAAVHEARPDAQFLVPLVTRADARSRSRRALHRRGREALPLTLLYGHADDALRAADVGTGRVRHGDARGGAGALPARHLLSRVAADRASSCGASCCCPTSGCPTCLRGDSSCPEFLQDDATRRQSRAGGAQPVTTTG